MEKTAFENDILQSANISQLILRGNLSGVDFNPEYLFYNLNNKIFKNLDYESDDDLKIKHRILKILKSGSREYKKYICNKKTVEYIIRLFCDPNRHKIYRHETANILLSYLQIINRSSRKMIRELHDSNGNNILMILIKMRKYDDLKNATSKVVNLPFSKGNSFSYLLTSVFSESGHLVNFINFMIREAKVDTEETNNNGEKFSDFINVDDILIEKDSYKKFSKQLNVK